MLPDELDPTRRAVLRACLAVPAALVVTPLTALATAPGAPVLLPTPACEDDDDPTPALGDGPFYKARSPRRTSLIEAGMAGAPLILTGRVLSTTCEPIPGAVLDFWQADDGGRYDNVGFRLRGHQSAGEAGEYRLETIVPGQYVRRTRHIHVRVQAPGRPVLSTQLYLPGEPRNASDFLFRPSLLMEVSETPQGRQAVFDFVLQV